MDKHIEINSDSKVYIKNTGQYCAINYIHYNYDRPVVNVDMGWADKDKTVRWDYSFFIDSDEIIII